MHNFQSMIIVYSKYIPHKKILNIMEAASPPVFTEDPDGRTLSKMRSRVSDITPGVYLSDGTA